MSVTRKTGNIIEENWGNDNEAIIISGHMDINSTGIILSSLIMKRVKDRLDDFNEIFTKKISEQIEAVKKADLKPNIESGESVYYGIAMHEIKNAEGKTIQKIALAHTKMKWDMPANPGFVSTVFYSLFRFVALSRLFGTPDPKLVLEDFTQDPKMKEGSIKAIERIYGLYPPCFEVWRQKSN